VRKRDAFDRALEWRGPERSEGPGEHAVLTRTNPSGAVEGHGFFGGIKSLERWYKAREGFVGKRKSGRST
jgi:hypothetical protein